MEETDRGHDNITIIQQCHFHLDQQRIHCLLLKAMNAQSITERK